MAEPLGTVVLGAMGAPAALEQLVGHVTLICPVDREDVLVSALSAMYLSGRKDFALASIIVTGKSKLSEMVTRMIRRTTLPTLHVDADAFTVASEVKAGNFKILPGDAPKIHRAIEIVRERVDLDALMAGLKT
jgi:BioD-like phosphotransacetylase family protein